MILWPANEKRKGGISKNIRKKKREKKRSSNGLGGKITGLWDVLVLPA